MENKTNYTVAEACKRLGIHPQTLRNWDRAGRIRVIRYPGKQRRVPASEIERILQLKNPQSTDAQS